MATGREERQAQLDEIHALSQELGAIHAKAGCCSAVRSRLVLALLKDLRCLTDRFFAFGRDRGVQSALESVRDAAARLRTSPPLESEGLGAKKYRDASEYALLSELEREQDLDMRPLAGCLRSVRQLEKTFAFQRRLWLDKQRIAPMLNCSTEQLTYGTTTFAMWHRLMVGSSSLRNRMRSKEHDAEDEDVKARHLTTVSQPKVVIFGSSLGLLGFYTSSLFPHARIVGYEVMPSLVSVARRLKDSYFPEEHIKFHQKDMMLADVHDADVVILTSMCWDSECRRRVATKLAVELPTSALVVDYYQETFSEFGLDTSNSHYSHSRGGGGNSAGALKALQKQKEKMALSKATERQLISSLSSVMLRLEEKQPPKACQFSLIQVIEPEKGMSGVSWDTCGGNQRLYVYQGVLA